jgi:23S rRNA pseudouridine955/2504/2580 synthase
MKDTYHTIDIDINSANQRLDRFLRKMYKPYTSVNLPMIFSRIRKWYIRVNTKKAEENTKIILWDAVQINISKTIELWKTQAVKKYKDSDSKSTLEMIRNSIIYEDLQRLVFNKPPHILMHPGSGSKTVTMNDRLYSYLNIERQGSGEAALTQWSTFKPAFCYRLDKDTSGVLIAAKTYDALQYLNEKIRMREVTKRYIVVCAWRLPKSLIIDKPLFKWFHAEKGKAHMFINHEKWLDSVTHVYSLTSKKDSYIGDMSLWLVRLMTGRMHQIRVHLVSEGYPVLWDKEYW